MRPFTKTTPRVILGTMSIGPKGQTNEADATKMLTKFCASCKELVRKDPMIDTAIMYQGGETEKVLGKIIKQSGDKLPYPMSLATEANPFTADKDLSPTGTRKQLEESLRSLQVDRVDIFYLHAPDSKHAIEPTLEEIQKLFSEGKFKRFALSNFLAWEVVYIHSYMSQRDGYIVPTIYQGMYNAITRQVETELFPALRKLNMSFFAYNPLAGGMLSGKYVLQESASEMMKENAKVGGRFAGNTFWAERYRERFQKTQQFEAIDIVKEALGNDDTGNSSCLADASLRWLLHHSKLKEQDGIIMGASRLSHFDANMASLALGPLPGNVVKAFNEACDHCKAVCPDYARGHSGSSLEN
mmetsp:Transcript_49031/g.59349  ORF Transcript_49031/g.59349 Transcript_49031/m.59349 type:complete len:356 (+) Transcript_49031:316-1383(+)